MGDGMEVDAPADDAPAPKEEPEMPKVVDPKSLSAPIVSAITENDLYAKYKTMEQEKDFLDVQEQYIKDEIKNLKRELIRAKEEIKRIQSVPSSSATTASSTCSPESDSTIQLMMEKPKVTYKDIGGLDVQKQEMREAVDTWARARMVRDVFRLARENAPAIIFIDEIDAIATKRFDAQTGADREVQRILLELLNQMDGFDQSTNVKVIMATNRADTLDPALLRPGRLDRKIDAIANEAGLHAVRENRRVVMPKDPTRPTSSVNKADTDFAFYTQEHRAPTTVKRVTLGSLRTRREVTGGRRR
ncbi:proteasome-activating ATPase [Aureococcus anophagefferens]|nr:proteasome-activating ATPase [Aureococcus anophagefferens]